VRRSYPTLPIIVLTMIHNQTLIRGMFAAGVQGVVEKAAFIKELLRRIAQHHLEAGNPPEVSRATADSALHEMLFSGGLLNKRLLGGEAIDGEAIEVN